MSDPFIGEIRAFGGNFAPLGWAFCDGQLLAISENDALFNLIGTTYGGDGQQTFGLPDLRGRLPLGAGSAYVLGEVGGTEQVTLSVDQLPAHRHAFASTAAATRDTPASSVLASPGASAPLYAGGAPNGALHEQANVSAGGSLPHSNLMPYLCASFIISLYGIFPPRN